MITPETEVSKLDREIAKLTLRRDALRAMVNLQVLRDRLQEQSAYTTTGYVWLYETMEQSKEVIRRLMDKAGI